MEINAAVLALVASPCWMSCRTAFVVTRLSLLCREAFVSRPPSEDYQTAQGPKKKSYFHTEVRLQH
jgi:hypothetical protein